MDFHQQGSGHLGAVGLVREALARTFLRSRLLLVKVNLLLSCANPDRGGVGGGGEGRRARPGVTQVTSGLTQPRIWLSTVAPPQGCHELLKEQMGKACPGL